MGRARDPNRWAFTLVELLVVISIIAVLMAILMPAIQKVRQQGRRVLCGFNLRNMYMAHKSYQTETGTYLANFSRNPYTPWYNHDGFRTGMGLDRLTTEQKTRRLGELQEWAPNVPRKMICPSAKWALDHPEDGFYAIDRSYGVNIDGDYEAAYKRRASNFSDKESWVKHHAQKLFLADAMDWWISYTFCKVYLEYGEEWLGINTYGATAFRHNGGVNVVYWDGHTGHIRQEEATENPRLWDPLR